MASRDYYEILGVARDASLADIKKAYRALAVKYHPDRNPGDKAAEEKFKEASAAYQVLSDTEQRRRYDTLGAAGVGGGRGVEFDPEAFADFSDILGDLFGGLFGGAARGGSARQRGDDLRFDLEIDLADAVRGGETTLRVPRTETCPTCSGSGGATPADVIPCAACKGQGQVRYSQGFFAVSRTCPTCRGLGRRITRPCPVCGGQGRVRQERRLQVRIPPGVDDGARLRLPGEGEGGRLGGPPGDLYVVLRVRDHPHFRREGDDLHCRIPITFSQAALGATVRVASLDGEHDLKVPPGLQSGSALRLRGLGVPHLGGRGRGDLVVTLHVETPRRLSRKARELLRDLAGEEERGRAEGVGLFDRVKDLIG